MATGRYTGNQEKGQGLAARLVQRLPQRHIWLAQLGKFLLKFPPAAFNNLLETWTASINSPEYINQKRRSQRVPLEDKDALQAKANTIVTPSRALNGFGKAKSVILMFLQGGPSHIDIWDPKPDAPSNVRGEFKPIKTNVPGIWLSETMPRLAKQTILLHENMVERA